MDRPGGELAEAQAELQTVKRALRENTAHLGMTGDTLGRYLLQLSEKENLLLSRQLQSSGPQGVGGAAPAPFLSYAGLAPGGSPYAGGGGGGFAQAAYVRPEPKQPPPGPVKPFTAGDRSSLPSILDHMCDYEAVPLESTRALRALVSLAYSDAAFITDDAQVLSQVLRLMAIHDNEPQVQLAAMRVLCNIAYDPDVALKRLLSPAILRAILQAMQGHEKCKGLAPKASEAAARLVAAEVCVPGEAVSDGGPIRKLPEAEVEAPGALSGFFVAAFSGGEDCQRSVVELSSQLISNEVLEPKVVAKRFAAAAAGSAPGAASGASASAWGWLTLARMLSVGEGGNLPDCLLEAGCIRVAATLMEQHVGDAATQLAGVEALSSLIGNRYAGLLAFAEVEGCKRIESALRAHGGDCVLQTKGVRALACGIMWPPDVQQKAGYSYPVGIELTKIAMSRHGESEELQTASFEALAKYLEKVPCVEEVKASGGEGLVKAMLTRHAQALKVQHWGKVILESIGSDRCWQPRGVAAPGPGPAPAAPA